MNKKTTLIFGDGTSKEFDSEEEAREFVKKITNGGRFMKKGVKGYNNL